MLATLFDIILIVFKFSNVARPFYSRVFYMQRRRDMKNLTTPQAVLGGLALIALAVASIPYSSNIVTPAHAYKFGDKAASDVQKVTICEPDGIICGLGASGEQTLPLSAYIKQNNEGPIPVTVE